jgi:hypothetical protein
LVSSQIYLIENHIIIAQGLPYEDKPSCDSGDEWKIYTDKEKICGYTWMDNFDMAWFFDKIGVSNDIVEWGEYDFDGEEDEE